MNVIRRYEIYIKINLVTFSTVFFFILKMPKIMYSLKVFKKCKTNKSGIKHFF